MDLRISRARARFLRRGWIQEIQVTWIQEIQVKLQKEPLRAVFCPSPTPSGDAVRLESFERVICCAGVEQ
jgi:hypothetical protein